MPAWQARRVARQTHRLPYAGARWVDDQLAARTGCGPVIVDRLVAQAIATYDPEDHEQREDDARADWDVDLTHPDPTDFAGTSHLEACGDTLTLKAFYDLVCALAHQLHLDGDPDPLGARKAKAIGLIIALATGQPMTSCKPKIKVYVRVDADDLDVDATGGSAFATGTIEKLGAATLTKIRDWVGHHQVVIQPVLNMQRGDAVDVHDPPTWMRELVILRDGHCIFPRCTIDARSCDLDHTVPYDPDGPPGQTRPDNLACLCRDTTAPRPPDSGDTPARPTAATNGADRTARRTSSSDASWVACVLIRQGRPALRGPRRPSRVPWWDGWNVRTSQFFFVRRLELSPPLLQFNVAHLERLDRASLRTDG